MDGRVMDNLPPGFKGELTLDDIFGGENRTPLKSQIDRVKITHCGYCGEGLRTGYAVYKDEEGFCDVDCRFSHMNKNRQKKE